MDVYEACDLSRLNQAGYEDKWGNFYLAEFDPAVSSSCILYMTCNKRSGNWNHSTITHINRVGNRWRTIAPYR